MIRTKQTLTEARVALEHAEGRAQHLHTLYIDALENMLRCRADLALIGHQGGMEAVIDAARSCVIKLRREVADLTERLELAESLAMRACGRCGRVGYQRDMARDTTRLHGQWWCGTCPIKSDAPKSLNCGRHDLPWERYIGCAGCEALDE